MDFSEISSDLLIGTTPAAANYDRLRGLGVRLVINMRVTRPPYPDPHQPPLNFLWLPSFDTMFLPIPVFTLMRGARAALKTIESGGKVYTHCAAGRHRGVAMGAAVLIAQGYDAESAIKLIKARRSFADPDIFYVRNQILKFEQAWVKQLSAENK